MTMLTLGQAAKETGLSKTAIARAIKSGRLSAVKAETGEYQIDPAELFRVYPVTGDADRNVEQQATPKDSKGLRGQADIWLELLRQVENERDDLRRRLDNSEAAREREAEEREKAAAELRRLTLLITHQSQPPSAEGEAVPLLLADQRQPAPPPQAEPEPPPATPAAFLGVSWQWWVALILAATGGAGAWFWEHGR